MVDELDELLKKIRTRPRWVDQYYWVRRNLSPKNIHREIRWGIQRWRRGYSDADVWDFDHYLALIIPPAMRQLGVGLHGVPGGMVEEFGSMEAAEVEWRRILEAVATGFEAWSTIFREYPKGKDYTDLEAQWKEGSRLFIAHFGSFWD